MNPTPTLSEQIALEEGILTQATATHRHSSASKPSSQTGIGAEFLSTTIQAYEDKVKDWVNSICDGGRFLSRYEEALWCYLNISTISGLSLKYLIDVSFGMLKPDPRWVPCVSSVSIQLGNRAFDQLNWSIFKDKTPELYRTFAMKIRGRTRYSRERAVKWFLEIARDKEGITPLEPSPTIRSRVGYTLLRLALETRPGLFAIKAINHRGRVNNVLTPNPELVPLFLESLEDLSWIRPVYQPMIIPPKPWEGYNIGGYFTMPTMIISHDFQRSREMWLEGGIKGRLDCLDYLGSIPYEIDKNLLGDMIHAYDIRHKSVPISEESLPEKPWSSSEEYRRMRDLRPEVYETYRREYLEVMGNFFEKRLVGQRIEFLRTLSIARAFKDYPRIWFPHRFDYRGRMYPIPTGLSPQGSDYGKSLLRFHQRTPLRVDNTDGWHWFLVHGANTYGIDNCSLEERVAWVRRNHDNIVLSAQMPWDHQWWSEGDSPWQHLAWAREYKAITSGKQSYTQIPMARDGKCNGIQHLALATRDKETGSLVGLDPNLRAPSDIYTECLKYVRSKLPEDSPWVHRLTRKWVKRNVMTLGYSVTKRGMADQLVDTLREVENTRIPTREQVLSCLQLRDYNWKYIRELLNKPVQLMEWYKRVAKLLIAKGIVPKWRLPDGFLARQDLFKRKRKKITLMQTQQTVVINYRMPTKTLDTNKGSNSISPNITHSLDAYHMAMVIRDCKAKGIPIAAVHDSFGMPSPDVHKVDIVKHLVYMYKHEVDPIGLLSDLLKEHNIPVPTPPARGDLNIESLRQALYAFT